MKEDTKNTDQVKENVNGMDIYEYLKKDHRLVSDLMEQVVETDNAAERERLFNKIYNELSIHADTEERTFYAELQERGGKQLQEKEEHAEHEHDEIRKFLEECHSTDIESGDWMLSFGQLKHAVEHHVEEEEGEIFEKAKKVISESRAEELAVEMEKLKQQTKRRMAA